VLDEHLAGRRHPHAARRPLHQREPDLGLQPADLLRQRRLRDPQPPRRPGEVRFVGDHDEAAQVAEFHTRTL
jgi:hypothetical protein